MRPKSCTRSASPTSGAAAPPRRSSRLERAYRLRPGDSRYGYAYAVGLDSQGKTADALKVLADVHRLRPADREVLVALATYEAKRGSRSAAIGWAQKLVDLRPEDRRGAGAAGAVAGTAGGGRRR